MPALIEARGVSKRFRQHKRFPGLIGAFKTLVTSEYTEVQAVSDIGFDITAGEAVGYLGPNGAGKSTMIKMMTGILVPSAGTLSVLGRTPHLSRMDNAREIGVVFWALALHMAGVRHVSSRYRALPFPTGRQDAVSAGRRAVASEADAISPNSFPVDMDCERDVVLRHDLDPKRASDDVP